MKKFFLSAGLVIAFGAYVAYNYLTGSSTTQQATATSSSASASSGSDSGSSATLPTSTTQIPAGSVSDQSTTAPAPAQTTAPSSVTKTTVAATPVTAAPTGQYVDGSYTGSVADAYYGNIQVEATISGGKLTDVTFLQYPNDRSTSRFINQQAMPELKAEAIQSQSANVDGVSGASDSSAAFKVSLADALSKAQA